MGQPDGGTATPYQGPRPSSPAIAARDRALALRLVRRARGDGGADDGDSDARMDVLDVAALRIPGADVGSRIAARREQPQASLPLCERPRQAHTELQQLVINERRVLLVELRDRGGVTREEAPQPRVARAAQIGDLIVARGHEVGG